MVEKKQGTTWSAAKKIAVPKTWRGWLVVILCLSVGFAPAVWVSLFYQGDVYCRTILQQGIEANCNPEVATPVYLFAGILWLFAWILILVQLASYKGQKPTISWGNKVTKAVKKHARKS